ncbi:protein sorting system archaetidylserine decarboxylase [Haloarchaeobius amylolyticus]|uniref:protein sorting system archaetidylserine decarboxylase n=1 Tax=Haloarchaeobius amylolyticus TaxID=1198296 RepID=UPI002271FFFA|nr:protein sorting system archaetidylserine decarboxylase [Haloarchaeobius amylolyticus]
MRFVPQGRRFAAVPLALAPIATVVATPIAGLVCVLLGAATLHFFRDPPRSPPESGVVSPADGRVSVVREEDDGRLRVGVFMNVTDVHVNRAPVAGTVESVEHSPGLHRPAFSKDSDRNEKVHIELATDDGPTEVTLIAGAFARRIHPWVDGGEQLARGERLGHIAFGSRADVLFPPAVEESDLRVSKGDTVRAGETVLVDR